MDNGKIFKGKREKYILQNVSIGKYIFDRLKLKGNEIAQIDEPLGKVVTYNEMINQGIKVAELFRVSGIGNEDVVLFCSSGDLEYAQVMLGTWWVGAIFAPLDPSLQTKEMAHMLNTLQPKIIFCIQDAFCVMQNAMKEVKSQAQLVCIDYGRTYADGPVNNKITYFQDFVKKGPSHSKQTFIPYSCSDIRNKGCLIMSSSGTTGFPKGVTVSHATLQLLHLQARKTDSIPENSYHMLLSTPPYWISGTFSFLMSIIEGATLVILRSMVDTTILKAIEKYKISMLVLSPGTVIAMSKNPDVEKYNTSSLITVLEGGAAVGKSTQQLLSRRLGTKVLELYGATELGLICSVNKEDEDLIEGYNCGMRLWDNAEVKIIDLETGNSLKENEPGEIIAKSQTQMIGYYNNPEATQNAVDEDGWYHTGDVGYFNDKGNLIICDRIKEVVKYRGTHVAPAELEAVLLSHSAVADAAVVGIEHETDGYHPLAFVVLKPNKYATEEELQELIKDTLSSAKWLRGGVKFISQIPRSSTGKILRRQLRQLI